MVNMCRVKPFKIFCYKKKPSAGLSNAIPRQYYLGIAVDRTDRAG